MPKNVLRLAAATLALALTAGCQAPGPRIPDGPEALQLEEARMELALAEKSLSPVRELHQLSAARLFSAAGDGLSARATLDLINADILPLQGLAEYSLLFSAVEMENDSFFKAQQLLSNPRLESDWRSLPNATQQQWLKARAELFALLGKERESIRNYSLLSAITQDEILRQQVHEQIWLLLSYLPHNSLLQRAETAKSAVLKGWYELALLNRRGNRDIRQQKQTLNDWRSRWPQHPANTHMPAALAIISQLSATQPAKVALLLPSTGKLAKAGESIRMGFLTAWYNLLEHYGAAGEVNFYNTAGQEDIVSLYQTAIDNSAEIVIGPLAKDRVWQLAAQSEVFPVPTLALNYLDDDTDVAPEQLFQLGLSVTDEATQIANRAWLEGQRHALTITPQTKWGEQALKAFQEEWEARGGTLELTEAYQAKQIDFAPLLRQPLHLEYSEQRKQRLQRLLGKRLAATPRRRQDLDMVFLVAYPQHARQIKPTLDFLFAGGLPVYATSHIYNGLPDPGRNRDLEGIKFSAMPWVLPDTLSENLQPDDAIPASYRQLFALGLDAFQLHQWLKQIEQLPGVRLFGSTGFLSLNRDRIVQRQQPWAIFRSGRVRPAPGPEGD